MCDCGIQIVRDPMELHAYINRSNCPRCQAPLNQSGKKQAHSVITAIVISSDNLKQLRKGLEKSIANYQKDLLVTKNGVEYHKNRITDLIRKIEEQEYDDIDIAFLDSPERNKILGMINEVRNNDNNKDETSKSGSTKSSFEKLSRSDTSESNSPQPSRKVIKNYLGICDILLLGVSHNAPILDSLHEEMRNKYVDLVMVESVPGGKDLRTDGVVGDGVPIEHKAAAEYGKIYDTEGVYVLQGSPKEISEFSINYPTSAFDDTWSDTSQEIAKEDRNLTEKINQEYYNAVINERDGKFAMEAVGYILKHKNMNGNACIIAGKSHIPGIYKKIMGSEI